MAKNPAPSDAKAKINELIPEHIRKVLGEPALLPFEDIDSFNMLLAQMVAHFDPQELIEYITVYEIAQHQWEISRLTSMRQTAVELALPAAAIQLMKDPLQRHFSTMHITEQEVRPVIRAAIDGSEDDRQVIVELGKEAGVNLSALQVTAYAKSLDTISSIEDMIAKRERRRDQFSKGFEERRRMKLAMSPAATGLKRTAVDVELQKSSQ